jgi:hypothetical protein
VFMSHGWSYQGRHDHDGDHDHSNEAQLGLHCCFVLDEWRQRMKVEKRIVKLRLWREEGKEGLIYIQRTTWDPVLSVYY